MLEKKNVEVKGKFKHRGSFGSKQVQPTSSPQTKPHQKNNKPRKILNDATLEKNQVLKEKKNSGI